MAEPTAVQRPSHFGDRDRKKPKLMIRRDGGMVAVYWAAPIIVFS
jgi:hypothetical protein